MIPIAETAWLLVWVVYLPLGLAVGSFSSVLWHRTRRGASLLWPRSHCPQCRHPLGPLELIPVLSFLWQRARCKWCRVQIPWRYPLVEVGCGALTAAAGLWGGWLAGFVAMAAWVVAVGSVARWGGLHTLKSEKGVTLVESLVACLLLTTAVLPILDVITIARHADLAAQRGTLAVGVARGRLNQLNNLALDSGVGALDGWNHSSTSVVVDTGNGTEQYSVRVDVGSYPAAPASSNPNLRMVTVTVSCTTCKGKFGQPARTVRVSSILRGRLNGE